MCSANARSPCFMLFCTTVRLRTYAELELTTQNADRLAVHTLQPFKKISLSYIIERAIARIDISTVQAIGQSETNLVGLLD
jgi:hypothetical protein